MVQFFLLVLTIARLFNQQQPLKEQYSIEKELLECILLCLMQLHRLKDGFIFQTIIKLITSCICCLLFLALLFHLQVISEIPYLFVQTIFFSFIVYAMVSFEWKVAKVLWFCFVSFFSFMYFTYYGMMTVSITPNPPFRNFLKSQS